MVECLLVQPGDHGAETLPTHLPTGPSSCRKAAWAPDLAPLHVPDEGPLSQVPKLSGQHSPVSSANGANAVAHGHSCLELFRPPGSRLCSLRCWTPWPQTKRPRISTLLWELPPRQPLAALCCPQLGRSLPARTPPAPSICTHHLGVWFLVSWGPLHTLPHPNLLVSERRPASSV